MMLNLRLLCALCIIAFAGLTSTAPVAAQTTITEGDLSALVGRSFTQEFYISTETEAAAALVDQTGPNQSWNLTPLTFELQDSSVWSYFDDPAEVPGGDDPAFAPANWISIGENETARDVSFNQLVPDSLIQLGSISYLEGGGDPTVRYQVDRPPSWILPLTYGTSWEYEGEVTSNDPFASGTYSGSAEVDAYGTLQTPDGPMDVLRVFQEGQFTSSFGTSTARTYAWVDSDFQNVAGITCPFFPGTGFVCNTFFVKREETNAALVSADGLAAFDGTGVAINLTGVSGSGTVTVNRYDAPPTGTEGITEANVSSYRVVIDIFGGLTVGPGTEVRFSVAAFSGITDPTDVTVYSRETPGQGSFTALPTGYDNATGEIVATVDRFSEFVLASNTNPLPVELTAFDATLDGDDVLLQWSTATETNNAGFEVQWRAGERENGGTAAWTTAAFVDGRGTTTEAQDYTYRVPDLTAGTYAFRLKQVDFDGSFELSPVMELSVTMTETHLLSEAFPNPVRGASWLTLQVRETQSVRADLFDVVGRRVATLHEGTLTAGREHRLVLSNRGLVSGLYLVRISGERFAETRRIVIAR
jgi:hypothetical protein